MTQEEKIYWTLEAMTKFGGSFVKALAELARRADSANLHKIRDTWALYWSQYDEIGARMWKEDLKDQEHLIGADHHD